MAHRPDEGDRGVGAERKVVDGVEASVAAEDERVDRRDPNDGGVRDWGRSIAIISPSSACTAAYILTIIPTQARSLCAYWGKGRHG